jgi:hypothetical protein
MAISVIPDDNDDDDDDGDDGDGDGDGAPVLRGALL